MKGSPLQKLLLVMTLAAIAVALLLQFINGRFKSEPLPEPPVVKSVQPSPKSSYFPSPPKAVQAVEAETNSEDQLKIPRDKAEAWLAKHNRNAASLLAVFRAQGDTNYLNEAATNFPNDPQVELAVLSHNAFPEDRRKWLDAFKASSPSNSLANYFSAEDYFKNGKPDEAMQELLAASGKEQFQNNSIEIQLDAEDLYRDSGKSPSEAAYYALSSMAMDNLPQLSTIKGLGNGIADLMKQKMDAGDANSAVNLAQMGMIIADKLNSGDSGKYLVNQLVGMASEAVVLSHLDQNTAYDFLDGQTPAQRMDALKQQKTELRKLMTDFGPAQMQMMQSESETANYMQRMKIYGEVAAKKWLIQQHPPATSQQ